MQRPSCRVGNSEGICTFSLACTYGGGKHLGICRDRFYFASCCDISSIDDNSVVISNPVFEAIEAEDEDNSIDDEVCGIRSPVPYTVGRDLFRIVGGNSSAFGAWPWQASLMVDKYKSGSTVHNCGAVVLGRRWAATAAHCVKGYDPAEVRLRLGDHKRWSESEPLPHLDRDVYEIFIHPEYDSYRDIPYQEFDLALLYVDEAVPFGEHVRPICLPEEEANKGVSRGQFGMGFVTGWGMKWEGGPEPSALHEAEVPVFNHRVCNDIFGLAGLDEKLTDTFICAGVEEGGVDACAGDSGGPLVIEDKESGQWYLAGIVSWGIGCGEQNQPGVYTNVAKLADWIRGTMGEGRRVRGLMV